MDRVLSPEPGTGELHEDPLFNAPDAGDFTLTALSPCIDAGNPDVKYNDPDETRCDMGAFYFHQEGSPVQKMTWGKVKTLFR